MKFKKKINNNFAFVEDDVGNEFIVTGRGIGFHHDLEIDIDESKVDKIFSTKDNIADKGTFETLLNINPDVLDVTLEVCKMAEKKLDVTFDNNTFIVIADHLSYAIKRYYDNINYSLSMYWELKKLYPKEYRVAVESLNLINERFGIYLDKTEISFITYHFVNVQNDTTMLSDTMKMTRLIKKIIDIVQYQLQIELNEDSFSYNRFINHLRYFFIRRISADTTHVNEVDELIIETVKIRYPKEYKVAQTIADFVRQEEGWSVSDDETLYLSLHVHRLLEQENTKK
ncbi:MULTISPECIES: PRD domain-containing protein [Breznakia]|uniref:BglG family transcriptional antiterminator n=1 Tax=Breznakia blatticola TaxID=1754012 RepID=A0A4R7Z8K7_9FIRM|nr:MULTISPECIES: PRD domain-containing protein [Breznakia]MDH6368101.1 beta-glucoside operon transcriptional antiterminator [Breznakia sp. PH1-1]MDH6405190.1 beta-glucoside operon transcriptional antiterminator [Breznakia sp. PF1-11]MDH6412906.1 beta-glucoside operon transcriptional antiterminator [Breznakia sp. PFB1-11]MDH6415268.1 beta-glucoside operon transcriptional antiterminator [Breznakia sp. PFB1-14]MDH6417577.1 beta-glucoside operon transcriptional antiterminator [Breznakia sp. PFB1-4